MNGKFHELQGIVEQIGELAKRGRHIYRSMEEPAQRRANRYMTSKTDMTGEALLRFFIAVEERKQENNLMNGK